MSRKFNGFLVKIFLLEFPWGNSSKCVDPETVFLNLLALLKKWSG
jgi:hypothetical protein